MKKISFPEAVRMVAEIVKVPVSELGGVPEKERLDYFGINKLAADFFHTQLFSEREALHAVPDQEGITPRSVKSFQLGCAAGAPRTLIDFMKARGSPSRTLSRQGLPWREEGHAPPGRGSARAG